MFGIDIDEKTLQTVWSHFYEQSQEYQRAEKKIEEVWETGSRGKKDREGDEKNKPERSGIRLLDDEESDHRENRQKRNKPFEKIRYPRLSPARKPWGQVQDNRQFHHFRWLERKRPDLHPARRTIHRRSETRNKNQDQKSEGDKK